MTRTDFAESRKLFLPEMFHGESLKGRVYACVGCSRYFITNFPSFCPQLWFCLKEAIKTCKSIILEQRAFFYCLELGSKMGDRLQANTPKESGGLVSLVLSHLSMLLVFISLVTR